jgi:hypothetical protein
MHEPNAAKRTNSLAPVACSRVDANDIRFSSSTMTDATNPSQMPASRSTDSAVAGYEHLRKSEELTSKSEDAIADLEKGSNDDTSVPAAETSFLVEFEGPNDPGNPKSWTPKRRWAITVSMGLMVFTVTFASSIFSVNIGVVQEKFNVELVTATLGVALFVLVYSPLHYTIFAVANVPSSRASSSDPLRSDLCQKSSAGSRP